MTPQERIDNWKVYESQKGYFAYEVYRAMARNPRVWLISGDLGFGMFGPHQDDFPERYINVGAAEQSMIGIAIGLALEGKIPFVYSIPNFLIYRPFEWVRNYIDHESIPVKLISGGRDKEYLDDGYTHQAEDMKQVLSLFPNIVQYWPEDKSEIGELMTKMIDSLKPDFLSLSRKK